MQDEHGDSSYENYEDSPLSPGEYAAARLYVACLGSHIRELPFNPSAIGADFTVNSKMPMAVIDDGTVVSGTDFVRAAIMLLLGLVCNLADATDNEAEFLVEKLGLSIASAEPRS